VRREAESCHRPVGRKSGEGHLTLISEMLADGSRAVLLFGERDAAEAFRIVEGLGEEWEMIEGPPEEIAELLGACAAAGARYVCLDPPTALTRGDKEPRLVPLKAFVDHLLEAPDGP
jgi:hypothetical protein